MLNGAQVLYVSSAFHRVYTFNPAFRADSSTGVHHLSEFYMIEAELNFTYSIEDLNTVSNTAQLNFAYSIEDLNAVSDTAQLNFMYSKLQKNSMR